MDRKNCYVYIKEHSGLKDLIKSKYGINYTNISTDVLNYYIDEYNKNNTVDSKKEYISDIEEEDIINITSKNISPVNIKSQVVSCDIAIERLCEVLVNKKFLLKKEREYIFKY